MIGRFFLKIGAFEVPRVCRFRVYKIARTENRVTSFAGTDRVDRSALKYRVEARISLLSETEMQTIQTAAEQITQSVQFYDGATLVTKNMIIDLPETPEPFYKYGDLYKYGVRTNGIIYTNYDISMEEA